MLCYALLYRITDLCVYIYSPLWGASSISFPSSTFMIPATLMQWHFNELRASGERHVFRPVVGQVTSREERQTWIRQALLTALPLHERKARELVHDVSPHSFRAGIAGDVAREGHSLQTVGAICRWNAQKAIRLYAERPCLSMFRQTDDFRVVTAC